MRLGALLTYGLLAFALLVCSVAPLTGVGMTLFQETEAIPLSRSHTELFVTTLSLAISVTFFSALLGVASGMALLFLSRWARYFVLYGALVTFFVPSYIYANAWIELVGYIPGMDTRHLFSLPGVVLVLSLIHFPVIMCATYAACMRIEQEKLEVARMEASVYTMFRHVMLPHAMPFIATGSLIVFLLSLTTYTVPSFFQVTTYSIEIFTLYNAFHNPISGIQLVLPVVGMALGVIVVWWLWVGYHLTHTSYHAPKRVLLKAGLLGRFIITMALLVLLVISVGLPVGVIVSNGVTVEMLRTAWDSMQHEWGTSIGLALGVTMIVLILSSLGTYLCDGLPKIMGLGIVVLVCIPFLISGPAWGIGIIQFWNQPDVRGTVYDHPSIAYLACVGKYLFIGWLGFTFALRSIRREYSDAARVFGLSRLRQYWTVVMPLTLPYALVMGAIVFLLVLGEVDSLLLVSPPGFTIIPVRVYGLMHYGPSPLVSAMAVLMMVVVGLTLGLLAVVTAWVTSGQNEREAT